MGPEMNDVEQRNLPVSQVLTYAHLIGSRYGFIITQSHLVVLRFCQEPIGAGTALSRPRRSGAGQGFSQSIYSGSTDISSAMENMSLDTGYISYVDQTDDYFPPEYCSIHWNTHGKQNLTIKLALACLCLLAVIGPRDIHDRPYPPLDSWVAAVPEGYFHVTTGQYKKRLDKSDRYHQPVEDDQQHGTFSEPLEHGLEASFDVPAGGLEYSQLQGAHQQGGPGPSTMRSRRARHEAFQGDYTEPQMDDELYEW
ncbi:uncharacterized protein B0I36DRAFT_337834 [Microdochium trichocladiopsis]|uniref:Uncharacterized protein n=1 Tax=Microdochium trichocladiopsis TaxID=1682393 RepID=A0A9P8XWL9_9PEZI|nr:uncharacterized protein B0I36DRAFT_337834 [Microdochium trichocladiopsis]KAH7016475.1 hypothetical protein B0I36DRAFT_337834 [Microdochium trichocladiopsis]